jgi:hypothetical protein
MDTTFDKIVQKFQNVLLLFGKELLKRVFIVRSFDKIVIVENCKYRPKLEIITSTPNLRNSLLSPNVCGKASLISIHNV